MTEAVMRLVTILSICLDFETATFHWKTSRIHLLQHYTITYAKGMVFLANYQCCKWYLWPEPTSIAFKNSKNKVCYMWYLLMWCNTKRGEVVGDLLCFLFRLLDKNHVEVQALWRGKRWHAEAHPPTRCVPLKSKRNCRSVIMLSYMLFFAFFYHYLLTRKSCSVNTYIRYISYNISINSVMPGDLTLKQEINKIRANY